MEFFTSKLIKTPTILVIYGATGDLTHRKLIPAMYHLYLQNILPKQLQIIGFSRQDVSDEAFRESLELVIKKVAPHSFNTEKWQQFSQNVSYHTSNFDDKKGYQSLQQKITSICTQQGEKQNRLFYLASAPNFFKTILNNLELSGLNQQTNLIYSKVIIEKPFGTDLPSSQSLNQVVRNTFSEAKTYRIDHYLGKESAQNIMVMRFANSLFEPLWNNRYISHIQITCAEDLGMEGGRGGYYDQSGALKDMVQNHLLQLLSLVAMEPPSDLSSEQIHNEKVKVLRSLRPLTDLTDLQENVVRAQYSDGTIQQQAVKAYLNEDRVNPQSTTETYVAMRLFIDNWRWSNVPFYLRVGKRMSKKATEISIHFKETPAILFYQKNISSQQNHNVLTIRIQPDEGTHLSVVSKLPGTNMELKQVNMDFSYKSAFIEKLPEAYERLLLDAIAGDTTLFARGDEVEASWQFIDQIHKLWQEENLTQLPQYQAGSLGPVAADNLLAKDGFSWHPF